MANEAFGEIALTIGVLFGGTLVLMVLFPAFVFVWGSIERRLIRMWRDA